MNVICFQTPVFTLMGRVTIRHTELGKIMKI
uniref:Uncharacterized protein n=1 Tax=Anguilla anguilla TaxID=7936 RepID=A0A0E9UPJ1_ANGAN